jgi:hypothetical protein
MFRLGWVFGYNPSIVLHRKIKKKKDTDGPVPGKNTGFYIFRKRYNN